MKLLFYLPSNVCGIAKFISWNINSFDKRNWKRRFDAKWTGFLVQFNENLLKLREFIWRLSLNPSVVHCYLQQSGEILSATVIITWNEYEFQSWKTLFGFHLSLILLENVCIQLFSFHLLVNSWEGWAFFDFGITTGLKKKKTLNWNLLNSA